MTRSLYINLNHWLPRILACLRVQHCSFFFFFSGLEVRPLQNKPPFLPDTTHDRTEKNLRKNAEIFRKSCLSIGDGWILRTSLLHACIATKLKCNEVGREAPLRKKLKVFSRDQTFLSRALTKLSSRSVLRTTCPIPHSTFHIPPPPPPKLVFQAAKSNILYDVGNDNNSTFCSVGYSVFDIDYFSLCCSSSQSTKWINGRSVPEYTNREYFFQSPTILAKLLPFARHVHE